jgi:general secretion pathway protein D
MLVGGGPYTVPVSINGASRLVALSISITYNPALVKVTGVTEGTFMQQGGVKPTFTQKVDAVAGRVDIAIARAGDQIGASMSGLVAAIQLVAQAAGAGSLGITGTGTLVGGGSAQLQFGPAGITIK